MVVCGWQRGARVAMEVLFEKIRGSCWVDRGSQHGFFNGRGGGLIENEKKERKRERVGFENNSTGACRISQHDYKMIKWFRATLSRVY